MTVRIIDETPDPSIVKRIVCRNCGKKLEYLPLDVQSRNGTDYSGGPDGEEWVVCPSCNHRCVIRSW